MCVNEICIFPCVNEIYRYLTMNCVLAEFVVFILIASVLFCRRVCHSLVQVPRAAVLVEAERWSSCLWLTTPSPYDSCSSLPLLTTPAHHFYRYSLLTTPTPYDQQR